MKKLNHSIYLRGKANLFFALIGCLIVNTVFLSTHVIAQEDGNLKGALVIDKNAKLELSIANRNFEKITNVQPVEEPKAVTYTNFQEVELILPKLDTKIKVVTMKTSDLTKLYGNYVKVGFGNYTTPYLEAFLNSKRNEKYSYGIHLKHFSSKNGPVLHSGLSENMVEAYATYIGDKVVVKGNAGFRRNCYNYYGYDHIESPVASEDSLRQFFNTINVTVGFENKNKNSTLNYNTNFSFYNLETLRNGWENEFLWNLATDYKLNANMKILLDGGVSYTSRTDSSSINRTLILAKPALFWQVSEKLKLVAGLNVAYANDTITDYANFHLYPRANVEYKLVDNKVVAFGGLEGDMQKNTLRSFSTENPFLGSNVSLFHTNKLLDFYGGIMGGLKGGINYKLKLSSASYKYLSFFNNSSTDTSTFTVLYNTDPLDVVTVSGEVGYEISGDFRLAFATSYFNYDVRNVEKPWHRPDYTGSILATYNLNKKLYFNADFYYIGGLRGKNYVTGQEIYLKEIADLNVKVDYLFSKSFSTFVEVNNILSQKYQRYLYYNNKGINVLAGLTFSF